MINEERLFDIGIPSVKGMSISVNLLNFNCVSDENEDKVLHILMNRLFEVNDKIYKKHKIPFISLTDFIEFTLDDELKTHICFNTDMVYMKSLELLHCKDEVYEMENSLQIRNKIKEVLQKLNKIRMRSQFEKEFPELYLDFCTLEEDAEEYKKISALINSLSKVDGVNIRINSENLDKYSNRLNSLKAKITKYDMDPRRMDYRIYITNMYKLFSRLFMRDELSNVMETIASESIDIQAFDCLVDENRLALLLATSHMSASFARPDCRTENFSYVTSYLDREKDNMDEDISVELAMHNGDEMVEDCIVNKKELFSMYKKFLLIHPEIQIFHTERKDFEGKTIEEIQEYINNYINEIEVSWEILPNDESMEGRYERLGSESLTDEEKTHIQESKERIFDEKSLFYENHKPYCIIKGKNSFNGYIGYIYPNGKVILDQFYELNSNRIASSAIYVMEIDEFIELSRKSKTEIIEGNLCQRIIHKTGWETKVEKCFEGEVTPDVLEDIQIAIKRLKYTK